MTSNDDLKVDVIDFQTGTTKSPGGQHAGSPYNGIRITHLPTMTMAQCFLNRSQHKNKADAMLMLELVLGSGLIGSGDCKDFEKG